MRWMSGRRGMAIYLVFMFLVFAAVLSYGLHSAMLHQHSVGHQSGQRLEVRALARSALSVVTTGVLRTLADRSSSLYRSLETLGPGDPSLEVDRLTLEQWAALTIPVCEQYDGGRTRGRAEVLVQARALVVPPDPALGDPRESIGYDSREKRCRLEIRIEASLFRPTQGTLTKKLAVAKEIRIQNLGVGTLGKFSLFASKLSPRSGNTVRAKYDGGFEGPCAPLTLHNGSKATKGDSVDAWKRRGFIFLGGSPTLHMAAGYTRHGELFTFLPLASLDESPPESLLSWELPGGDPAQLCVPSGITSPGPVRDTSIRYRMLRKACGFFSDTDKKGRALKEFFPGHTDGAFLSSGLRLFGTWDDPSPALVLGNVARRYVVLSFLVIDVVPTSTDPRAPMDEVAALLTHLPKEDAARSFPAGMPNLPSEVTGLAGSSHAGQTIQLIPPPKWTELFPLNRDGTSTSYRRFSSRFSVDDPYSTAYDFLYRQDGAREFYPTEPSRIPSPPLSVCFERKGAGGETRFEANIDLVSASESVLLQRLQQRLTRALGARAVYRVRDGAELVETFVETRDGRSRLRLGTQILLTRPEKTVDLGALELVPEDGGGMLITGSHLDPAIGWVPSNIHLESLSGVPDTGSVGLILSSLNGCCSIAFPPAGEKPMPVSVITPRGYVELPRDHMNMKGTLVAKWLPLTLIKTPSDLTYNPALDPTADSYDSFYRAYVSDDEDLL